jgi:hypothetical protein
MKTLLVPALLALAALVLGTTLVLTCTEPTTLGAVSMGRTSLFPQSSVPFDLGNTPTSPQSGFNPFSFPAPGAFPRGFILTPTEPEPPEPKLPFLARQSDNQSQAPGVYQTYPYTLIIIGPPRGIDDRSIIGAPSAPSRMPIIKPHVELVPKS